MLDNMKNKPFGSISCLSVAMAVIAVVMTEATNSDNYELFHSRSASNLTLSHPSPESRHFMAKTSNSNNGMPSSGTSAQSAPSPETGNALLAHTADSLTHPPITGLMRD